MFLINFLKEIDCGHRYLIGLVVGFNRDVSEKYQFFNIQSKEKQSLIK